MTPERWAQIEELFHRAAECDLERRSALLDEACGADGELRQEVEALLSCAASARSHVQAAVRSELLDFGFGLSGQVVSHYRILGGLGGGGMGLVYQAEDLRLGRRVALKFLPGGSTKDPAALARFEREARAASALEHPNICPIYEFGEHEGQPFLVMQLLDGQTLRELLEGTKAETSDSESSARTSLALDQVLNLAIQIANGLEAAHRKGIIHRDIKPANIFVTSQGQAKILDFGLAKLVRTVTDEIDELESNLDNANSRKVAGNTTSLQTPDPFLSRTGVAMGTAGYMSPEQARGERLDARSDIFSFGLLLYEMATGHRAFDGDTGTALHDAILTQTPVPARQVNPQVPTGLAQIISKAIEKDREARYQSASEMRADLEALKHRLQPRNHFHRFVTGVSVLALFVGGTIFWIARRQLPSSPPAHDIRFHQLTINSSENPVTSGAISPDGKYLVYVDAQGMHVKDLDIGAIRVIAQPSDLTKGSTAWEIIDLGWFPDNTRFLANSHPVSEYQVDWSTRTSNVWIFSRLNEEPHEIRTRARAFSVSPDGSWIAFGVNTVGRFGDREVWFMDPSGEHARKMFETDENSGISQFIWSPDGQRGLFLTSNPSGRTLLTRDIRKGLQAVVLTSDQISKRIRGDVSWLPDGHLIYQAAEPGSDGGQICNFWAMRVDVHTGKLIEEAKRLTSWTGLCSSNANVTADGRRLAFVGSSGEHGTAYIADLEAGGTRVLNPRRFTLEEDEDFIGDWSADSKAVLIGMNRRDHYGLFRQSLDSDTPEPIAPAVPGGELGESIFSPDGKWVLAIVFPLVGGPSPSNPSVPVPLVRIPVAGGVPEPVLQVVRPGPFSCARAPATLCVIPEQTADHKQVIVTAFDPIKGRGPEVARFDLPRDMNLLVYNLLCVLSPDGSRLAFARSSDGPIEIHSLRHRPTQIIHAEGLDKLWNIQWAADGRALLVAKKVQDVTVLLHVDMDGKTTQLWKSAGPRCFGVPSPNGRHLAIYDWKRNSNMWMMENF